MARKKDAKAAAALLTLAVMAVAGAIAMPYIGARNLVRGYERSVLATVAITVLGNLLLVAGGLALGALVFPIILAFFDPHSANAGAPEADFGGALALTAISATAGLLVGMTERPKRMEEFAVVRDNAQFLARSGILATGREDVTHYDAQHNPLRYMETSGQQQIFMAVGRRNKRAYIQLDTSGRMVSYSGIVSL